MTFRKIWKHDYVLNPLRKPNAQSKQRPRQGCLLKVQWSLNQTGYSDLFPWPEFGDPSLEDLLMQVASDNPTHPLVLKSLWRNSADGWSRSQGRSLFQSLIPCESHGLLPSENTLQDLGFLRDQGFRFFKLKLSKDLGRESALLVELCSQLRPGEKLRLDFNGSLRFEQFKQWIERLPEQTLATIDLIEDPWVSTGEEDLGKQVLLQGTDKLASDFFQHPLWPHQIVKTARASAPTERPQRHRVIQTHSMDHPLGQAFSLWEASRYERLFPHRREIHGVARTNLYSSTDFDWAWNGSGPKPHPPTGLGVGFDDLLKSIKWEKLG